MTTNPVRHNVARELLIHGTELAQINELQQNGVEAVIWNRSLPASILNADILPNDVVSDGRDYVPVNDVYQSVREVLKSWRVQNSLVSEWIAQDVQSQAHMFAKLLSVSHLSVRVECIRDDACRRFHRDNVKARLICTYFGPGTQYGFSLNGEQPEQFDTVPTGLPIVLKGKQLSTGEGALILHRSPPIEGTGITRLVVVLDEGAPDVKEAYFSLDVPPAN